VHAGDPLATIHARSEQVAQAAVERLQKAWRLVPNEVFRLRHVLARVDANGVTAAAK
jgi:thymidine phosphorylase